jgi:ABC-type microcin C transport system duplicated ATPase subunit YejF
MQAHQLVIGRAYFVCGYYFRNRPIPTIETWIYVGTTASTEGVAHLFEDPATYYAREWTEERPKEDKSEMPEAQRLMVNETDLDVVSTLQELEQFLAALRSDPNAAKAF